MADAGKRAVRPLAIEYAERVPLEERPGRYDEARGLWVVRDGAGEVPLIRARGVVLQETVTKVRAEPTDRPRPRRASGDAADRDRRAKIERAALGETETRVPADPTDPSRPRRGATATLTEAPHARTERAALGETKTSVKADPTDPPRPRRVAVRRWVPEETLTFVDDEDTDESRPRRSGR